MEPDGTDANRSDCWSSKRAYSCGTPPCVIGLSESLTLDEQVVVASFLRSLTALVDADTERLTASVY
jgi:hypothetical protein